MENGRIKEERNRGMVENGGGIPGDKAYRESSSIKWHEIKPDPRGKIFKKYEKSKKKKL